MIGLQFKIKNEYNNFLYKILCSVDVENYEWKIITDDIICSTKLNKNNGIFDSDVVNGKSFLSSIIKENYYIIFVDLKAFPINSTHTVIKTFTDFLESECQIIVLCTDSENVEFYCKQESILDVVYNNCIKFGFENIEYISNEEANKRSMIAF